MKHEEMKIALWLSQLKKNLGLEKVKSKLGKLELPLNSVSLYEDEVAVMAGFGYEWVALGIDKRTNKLDEIDGGTTYNLKFAKTLVVTNDKCTSDSNIFISEYHLCAKVLQRNLRRPEGMCSVSSSFYLLKHIIMLWISIENVVLS